MRHRNMSMEAHLDICHDFTLRKRLRCLLDAILQGRGRAGSVSELGFLHQTREVPQLVSALKEVSESFMLRARVRGLLRKCSMARERRDQPRD